MKKNQFGFGSVLTLILLVLCTVGGAFAGWKVGGFLKANFGAAFTAYNWDQIRLIVTAALGVCGFLLVLPYVFIARLNDKIK